MQLTSPAFDQQEAIPARYTCDGEDVSPPLVFAEVPDAAQSLTLIMDDPDVPTAIRADGTWDHWIVFNIPPGTTEITKGCEPKGVHGTGTSGNMDYHGPCPPDREHRYFFKLFALDVQLDLPEGSSKAEVEQAMAGHVLEQVELMGRYKRS